MSDLDAPLTTITTLEDVEPVTLTGQQLRALEAMVICYMSVTSLGLSKDAESDVLAAIDKVWDRLVVKKDTTGSDWISVEYQLPIPETPVLVTTKQNGVQVLFRVWERCNPMIEPYYPDFLYWDDPNNDGMCIEDDQITHWMPLPEPPEATDE